MSEDADFTEHPLTTTRLGPRPEHSLLAVFVVIISPVGRKTRWKVILFCSNLEALGL